MTNPNGAGTKQNSDQNSDGATLGQSASDEVGFHGAKSTQHTTIPLNGAIQSFGGSNVDDTTIFNGGLTIL